MLHEVIGAGLAEARRRRGMRQEDAARDFARHGLTKWNAGAVGQVENGTRKPGLGELLLACSALRVSLASLIPDSDGTVEIRPGVAMPARVIRDMLSGCVADAVVAEPVRPQHSDAVLRLARATGGSPDAVARLAAELWGTDFEAERDSRAARRNGSSMAARRGHATREMGAEIGSALRRY